jgi:glycosyltransferase involved in cell wall biosynthesis
VSEPIFINGRFLAQPSSGVQRYAREIVRALDRRPGAGDYVLLTPQGAAPLDLKTIPTRTVSGPWGHPWEQTALALAARNNRLLSLGGSGPILHQRQTVVIHDAAVFRHPEHFRPAYAGFHRLLGRTLARRARLATVSHFSRAELADVLETPAEAIALAPNGADHFAEIAPEQGVLDRLDVRGRPFFIALGNLAPNKNIVVMIRALRRLPDANVRLVLVGGRDQKVFSACLGDDPRLLLAGRLTDAEVAGLLGTARALVFASLYEGFGIPPLEAFARNCPVLASDIPPVREVCGDAPSYFDPADDAALARLMHHAINHPADSTRRALAQERVTAYRWDASAAVLDALARTS